MPTPRIYCPELTSELTALTLTGDAANHVGKVLRLKPQDSIELFNGDNLQCRATIQAFNKNGIQVTLDDFETLSRESPIALTLIQAISKGDRMDWTLQKATELGVSRILPFFSQHSVVKLDNKRLDNRIQHWRGVLSHACEQCGRNQLPELLTPVSNMEQALSTDTNQQRLYLQPSARTRLKDITIEPKLSLIIGPEGGFSNEELGCMQANQLTGITLGPRILRTETAGIAALAALGAISGDL